MFHYLYSWRESDSWEAGPSCSIGPSVSDNQWLEIRFKFAYLWLVLWQDQSAGQSTELAEH